MKTTKELLLGLFFLVTLAALLTLATPDTRRAVAQQLTGLTPKTADAANSLQVKALPGSVYYVSATNETATAGVLIGYNSAAVPGTGALTAASIVECATLPASGRAEINHEPGPPTNYGVGITYLLSSATTCATYTTGVVTGFISVKYQ